MFFIELLRVMLLQYIKTSICMEFLGQDPKHGQPVMLWFRVHWFKRLSNDTSKIIINVNRFLLRQPWSSIMVWSMIDHPEAYDQSHWNVTAEFD